MHCTFTEDFKKMFITRYIQSLHPRGPEYTWVSEDRMNFSFGCIYAYLSQRADGSELLWVKGEGRSLTQPVVEEPQLCLVPVENKVSKYLWHQMFGQGREREGEELVVATYWDSALHLSVCVWGGEEERRYIGIGAIGSRR